MNNSGYIQLSNPNRSLKLALMQVENHWELLLQYFHYLGQGFLSSHVLSQSPQILRANVPILIT